MYNIRKIKKMCTTHEKTYSEAVSKLIEIISSTKSKRLYIGTRHVKGELAPMNVDLINAIADPINIVYLDKDGDLYAEGLSGQKYPLGVDFDGQDNFEIAGIDILLREAYEQSQYIVNNI